MTCRRVVLFLPTFLSNLFQQIKLCAILLRLRFGRPRLGGNWHVRVIAPKRFVSNSFLFVFSQEDTWLSLRLKGVRG